MYYEPKEAKSGAERQREYRQRVAAMMDLAAFLYQVRDVQRRMRERERWLKEHEGENPPYYSDPNRHWNKLDGRERVEWLSGMLKDLIGEEVAALDETHPLAKEWNNLDG